MRVHARTASLAAIAVVLTLTACGSDGSSTGTGGTSTATPTPTSTATTTPTPTPTPTATATSSTANAVGTGVSQGTGTAAVVTAANTFLATLSATQTAETGTAGTTSTVRFTLTRANAIQWTNLPGNRQGLRLNTSTLTAAQLAAAENLMATALSAAGKTEQDEIRRADDVLNANGYGSGLYSIAILGTPSTTTPWMLQIAGHHLAYNIMYNGTYVSGSPAFLGVEPPNWVVTSTGTVLVNGSVTAATAGTQHAPLETQRVAAYNLAQALQANSSFASGALLSGTYNDVVAGANGNTDSSFGSLAYPTSGRGLLYTALDTTTQGLVRALIESYVNTQPSDRAATLLGVYEGSTQLAGTYVGYARGQSGTADFGPFPSGTSSQRSYIRIDGPRIWIEFVVQQGVLYSSQVHYHSIWRDKVGDYGGQFGNGSTNFSGG